MTTRSIAFLVLVAAGLGALTTAAILSSATTASALTVGTTALIDSSEKPLVEGPIHYVVYEMENGKDGGFTRIDDARAVPGGNGSWNVHAYGKLYRDYLIVTKPSEKNWGVQVIPASRLRQVHFAQD